jgi:hypothetical protein
MKSAEAAAEGGGRTDGVEEGAQASAARTRLGSEWRRRNISHRRSSLTARAYRSWGEGHGFLGLLQRRQIVGGHGVQHRR